MDKTNTFKFNTTDNTAGERTKSIKFPEELAEEDRFLAEILTELAPLVRAAQITEGGFSNERRTELLSNVKKVFKT